MSEWRKLWPDPTLPPARGGWASPIDLTPPIQRDTSCQRCSLSAAVADGKRCLPVDLQGSTRPIVLIVGGAPGMLESQSQRPVLGEASYAVRALVSKVWPGAAAYTHAIGCEARRPEKDAIAACRGFLANAVAELQPDRIVACGRDAWYALTGRTTWVRRGVGFVQRGRIPILSTHEIGEAKGNRFLWRELLADVEWALRLDPSACQPPGGVWRVVETGADIEEALDDLRSAGELAFDCEWFAPQWDRRHRTLTVACAPIGDDRAWVWNEVSLRRRECREALATILTDPRVTKHGHNLKADVNEALICLGIRVGPEGLDTRLVCRALDADRMGDLDLLGELVGFGGHKGEAAGVIEVKKALVRKLRGQTLRDAAAGQRGFFSASIPGAPWLDEAQVGACLDPSVPEDSVVYGLFEQEMRDRYCARDAVATARLTVYAARELAQNPSIAFIHEQVIKPAAHAYARMEEWGLPVDRGEMELLGHHFSQRLAGLDASVRQWGGPAFNPGSDREVEALLFDKLGLDPIRRTPTGLRSTDDATLAKLEDKHPAVPLIRERRSLARLKGTYIDGFTDFIRADGRIHPNVLPDGASTGRPSCHAPNLYNIPRAETEDGKAIRRLFVAPPGRLLLEPDISQGEIRLAAVLSGDEEMAKVIIAGLDFHMTTAKLISRVAWGIEPEQVTRVHRQAAKSIVFGLLYGKTIAGLARELGISEMEAARIKQAILGKFQRLAEWIRSRVDFGREHGGVYTWWMGKDARWRPLKDLGLVGDDRHTRQLREEAERATYNTPVQGTCADYMTKSFGTFVNWIEETGSTAKVLAVVYDSLLTEVDEVDVDRVADEQNGIFTSWPSNGVPIVVDFKVGKSWGDMKKFVPPSLRGLEGGPVVAPLGK